MNTNTKIFAFILGREKELAYAELISVLEHFCFVQSGSSNNPAKDDVFRISGNTVFAKMDVSSENEKRFFEACRSLAGTIKVFQIVGPSHPEFISGSSYGIPKPVRDDLIRHLSNNLDKSRQVNFGLSDYSGKNSVSQLNRLGIDIKIILKKNNYKTRFVASKDGSDLSSILTLKNDLVDRGIEIGIFGEEINYRIGELIYLNNPEEWNERDYGKPKGDKYSGMLPPKLARMLVNLAIGQVNYKLQITNHNLPAGRQGKISNSQITNQKLEIPVSPSARRGGGNCNLDIHDCKTIVVDPFCGSGNVLMEAMMLGYDVVGSDISPKAVSDTKTNLEWLAKKITNNKLPVRHVSTQGVTGRQITNKSQIPNPKSQIFQCDATGESFIGNCLPAGRHGNLNLPAGEAGIGNYDNIVIVTEPYLGRPKKYKPTLREAQSEYGEIKKLYLSFLSNLTGFYTSNEVRSSQPLVSNNKHLSICLVFPLVETAEGGCFSLYKECVDEIKKMGYTQLRSSYIYGRDYQIVKREIVRFKLT